MPLYCGAAQTTQTIIKGMCLCQLLSSRYVMAQTILHATQVVLYSASQILASSLFLH
jgi:hypothetical protein